MKRIKSYNDTGRDIDMIEVAVDITAETPMAYRLSDGTSTEWVPKSQVEYDHDKKTCTMPEWLAKQKGFI